MKGTRLSACGSLLALVLLATSAQGSYWFRSAGVWTPAGSGQPAPELPGRVESATPLVEKAPAPAVAQAASAPAPAAPAERPSPAVDRPAAPPPERPVPEPEAAPLKTVATPPPPARVPVAVQLDLEQLEQRLRATKAIGMFTKLELKGQVGDLVERFEAYHENEGSQSLSQLERQFDLLMMKVLTLLQEDDKPLHREIAAARPALWSTLSDPVRFAQYARS